MYSHGRLALTSLVVLGLTTIFAGCSDNPAGPRTTNGSSDQELRSLTQDPAFAQYFSLEALDHANSGPGTPVILSPITDLVRREVTKYAQSNGYPPDGWGVAGWSQDGFSVTVPMSCRHLAGKFLTVVEVLEEIAGASASSRRCVFEFIL